MVWGGSVGQYVHVRIWRADCEIFYCLHYLGVSIGPWVLGATGDMGEPISISKFLHLM